MICCWFDLFVCWLDAGCENHLPQLPVSLRSATAWQEKVKPISVISKKSCQVVFFKLPGNG